MPDTDRQRREAIEEMRRRRTRPSLRELIIRIIAEIEADKAQRPRQ